MESSAGTGNLLRPLGALGRFNVTAVEVRPDLADQLCRTYVRCLDVRCADFLATNGELGQFDRIVMNPPFANASDIKHVEHALTKLKDGGRLVAVVANGPRQREKLMPIASAWIDLPAGSFKEQGTNVNSAIVVIDM